MTTNRTDIFFSRKVGIGFEQSQFRSFSVFVFFFYFIIHQALRK